MAQNNDPVALTFRVTWIGYAHALIYQRSKSTATASVLKYIYEEYLYCEKLDEYPFVMLYRIRLCGTL